MSIAQICHDLANNGICGGSQELFFSSRREDWEIAKDTCLDCPVKQKCLTYAVNEEEVWGVWGGSDQMQIRRAAGLDANGEPHSWPTNPCPNCESTSSVRSEKYVDKSPKRHWMKFSRTCLQCHFTWLRHEPVKLSKSKK